MVPEIGLQTSEEEQLVERWLSLEARIEKGLQVFSVAWAQKLGILRDGGWVVVSEELDDDLVGGDMVQVCELLDLEQVE